MSLKFLNLEIEEHILGNRTIRTRIFLEIAHQLDRIATVMETKEKRDVKAEKDMDELKKTLAESAVKLNQEIQAKSNENKPTKRGKK